MSPDRQDVYAGSIAYRPEIDGLRALAIIFVVLFHAGLGASAGYTGVDIFFVISGYLITSILAKEWEREGRIDLARFYARRFRRLFAAFSVVVLTTLVASAAVLSLYGGFAEVARSAAAGFLYCANFYFQFTTGGYFDARSELAPLLHLWSLSVEEQFYLLWPVLLLALLRLSSTWRGAALSLICLASLCASQLLLYFDPQAAFYQMPSRLWELAVGGWIALSLPAARDTSRALPLIGLAVVVASAFLVIDAFPGLGALPPVIGTSMVLLAVHNSRNLGPAGVMLKHRAMVYVGLISYPLYLWHWPLLALARVQGAGELPLSTRIAVILGSVVLAVLTYHCIERPIRRARFRGDALPIIRAGVLASVAIAVSAWRVGEFLELPPLPTDLASVTERDKPENLFSCRYYGAEPVAEVPRRGCVRNGDRPATIAIWGDSLALAWQPFAWALSDQLNAATISYLRDACPPMFEFRNDTNPLKQELCREFNSAVLANMPEADVVMLSALWMAYFQPTLEKGSSDDFANRLRKTLHAVSAKTERLIVIGPTPWLRDTAPRCIRLDKEDACALPRAEFEEKTRVFRELLARLVAEIDAAEYIDPTDFFCTQTHCPPLKDGYGLYWDTHHVSTTAARAFGRTYLEAQADPRADPRADP